MKEYKGKLYIVGTPIGNLKDITLRAIETLNMVDVILAEDTRQTLKLLNHLKISKHLISYHRHNEELKISNVVSILDTGKNVAIVSDAGMPVISDPGEKLVKYLIDNNYSIEVIPGVTAITTAIVKSNLDASRFVFEGFLSVNKKQRKQKLEILLKEPRTIIFYEAPHKLLSTLKDLLSVLGNRKICIARELTKLHEEYIYTNLEEAVKKYEGQVIKGEIVLIVEGKNEETDIPYDTNTIVQDIKSHVKKYMEEGVEKKDAIKKVAKEMKIAKSEVYKECIEIKENK